MEIQDGVDSPRPKTRMNATDILSKVVTRIKGDTFRIDNRIPVGYLLNISLNRVAMRIRGYVRFPRAKHKPFVGPDVHILAKKRIELGRNVTLSSGSVIDAMGELGVRLGDNSSLGKNSRIECTGSIKHLGVGFMAGNNVGLGTDNLYGAAGGISIGDDTIVGNYVSFHSENHVAASIQLPIRTQGVTHLGIEVGSDCWIGARVTVLDGAIIEDGCIIAAGSVLTSGRYEKQSVYGGVPARLIKRRSNER